MNFRAWGVSLWAGAWVACVHTQQPVLTPREQAQVSLHKGDYEQARVLLTDLHQRAPQDLDVARSLVEASVKSNRAEPLVAQLKRDPQTAVTHYMLGLTYFARAADAGQLAVSEFQQAIDLDPNNAEFHHRLGVALLESERYPASVAPLRRATELAPERASLYLPLAKALARTGDAPGAVAALRTVVRAHPSPAEVATARALMDRVADPFAGFPKAAQEKLDQGLEYLHRDAPQAAIVSFEEILRDFPDLAAVHSLLGLSYQRLDDAGRAVEEFKRAIELAPTGGQNYFYLGELYLSRQRADQAAEAFTHAEALHPLIDEAYFRLGDIALERQDLKSAHQQFEIAASLQPDNPSAHGKLALVLQLEGDYAAADRELQHVLQKTPDDVEFMLRAGLLNLERRKRAARLEDRRRFGDEAGRWFHKVLDAQPDNALASRGLESLQVQQ